MGPGRLFASIAALFALAWAMPAAASGFCHAAAAMGEDYAAVAANPARWSCSGDDLSLAPERTYLRFRPPAGAASPGQFATRLTRFEAMRLTVTGRDGSTATRDVGEAGMRPASDDWEMRTALPRISTPIAEVVVRVDRPRHLGMLGDARLTEGDGRAGHGVRELLFAGLCGLLCAPFLFNFAFYRVLRQRFLIWHTAMVVCMAIQTLVVTGLINRFVTLSIFDLSLLSVATFGGGVAAAALFAADLIEPDKLDAVHRRVLVAIVPWVTVFSAFYFVADGALRPFVPSVYFPAFIPVILAFGWVMAVALRRGSRAVKFQIAAWLPIMVVGIVRVASNLGATATPLDLNFEQHLAIVAEILITALAVVDRFMVLRRQRDHAWFETRQLEEVVERDALTGLMNRRALEQRFAVLRDEGFTTLGVIDLDHFKAINDTQGHAAGDAVLRAVAEALAPDVDTLAVRYGGEEFVLLLRGAAAADRAERRRAAIPARVAAAVVGLDRVVTASMGLVEQAPEVARKRDFAALFAHCDRLLYEAKHNGRNRTMSERLQVFSERRPHSRRGAAA